MHPDDGYRLTSATNLTQPSESQSFTYDAINRITTSSRYGAYSYPPAGDPRPHAPTAVNGTPLSYDLNGNTLTAGSRSLGWNADNLVVHVTLGTLTTSFAYDGLGERVKKSSPAGESLYPFGDDYEITNGVVTKYINVDGLGVIAKRVTGGPTPGTYWLHTDRQGSVQAVTDATGAAVLRRKYRPYGETLAEVGAHTESRGWIDQRNDSETGLTYLHARYLDSQLGIFLSPDPIGIVGGPNEYGYSLGDPINSDDRSGLISCKRRGRDGTCEVWQLDPVETGPGSWAHGQMNAPTTMPGSLRPNGRNGGNDLGDGSGRGGGGNAGGDQGGSVNSSGGTGGDPPGAGPGPTTTPKTYPVVVVSLGAGAWVLAGEGGSVFVLDPETGMVYEYFYLGGGVGLGFGANGAVETGVMDLTTPDDLLGWGVAVSAFAAAGPKGVAVAYSGNSFWGNGSSGGTGGWAGGGGFGVSGIGTYTWRTGHFSLSGAPQVVRDAFGRR